jgi:hypothetical protein
MVVKKKTLKNGIGGGSSTLKKVKTIKSKFMIKQEQQQIVSENVLTLKELYYLNRILMYAIDDTKTNNQNGGTEKTEETPNNGQFGFDTTLMGESVTNDGEYSKLLPKQPSASVSIDPDPRIYEVPIPQSNTNKIPNSQTNINEIPNSQSNTNTHIYEEIKSPSIYEQLVNGGVNDYKAKAYNKLLKKLVKLFSVYGNYIYILDAKPDISISKIEGYKKQLLLNKYINMDEYYFRQFNKLYTKSKKSSTKKSESASDESTLS